MSERERVAEIVRHQANPDAHPLTCGKRGDHPVRHGDKGVLYPALTPDGVVVLLCPDCDYSQPDPGGVGLLTEGLEPVAWYRVEDGLRVYYESEAWPDLVPLYTHAPRSEAEARLRKALDDYNEACIEVDRLKRDNAKLIVALPNEETVDEVLRLRKALEEIAESDPREEDDEGARGSCAWCDKDDVFKGGFMERRHYDYCPIAIASRALSDTPEEG